MLVGLATCRPLPEPDPDEAPLFAALRAAGIDAAPIVWHDPDDDPGRFDLVILRSTWDYHRDPARFLDWIDIVVERSRLLNPERAVRWNLHKSYLAALERRGIPIVPTAWAQHAHGFDLEGLCADRDWRDIVIKPAIACASDRCARFATTSWDRTDEAQRFLDAICVNGDALIQPYVPSVERGGERAIVWIDGEPTHVVTKSPRFHGGDERVSAARAPTDAERDFAQRAVAAARQEGLLYARVDVMERHDGTLMLSELELIEPSLFFPQWPAAVDRFAAAVARIGAAV